MANYTLHCCMYHIWVIITPNKNDKSKKKQKKTSGDIFFNCDVHRCQLEKYEGYTVQVTSMSYLVQTLDGA